MANGIELPTKLRIKSDGLCYFDSHIVRTTGQALDAIQREGFPASAPHWIKAYEALFSAEETDAQDALRIAYEALKAALDYEGWLRT
jgi:hypothetical protein